MIYNYILMMFHRNTKSAAGALKTYENTRVCVRPEWVGSL